MLSLRWLSGSAAVALIAACAASGEQDDDDAGGGSPATGGAGGTATTTTTSAGGSGPSTVTSGTGGSPIIDVVYGHSADVLYELDPQTNSATVVGSFSGGCDDVIDIAIDKDNVIVAATFGGIYEVDGDTAACSLISNDDEYPNSLSFVPAGTVDPNDEALVGYFDHDYVRIDRQTGQVTTILQDAITSPYVSSGDIVSVEGGGTYLTIKGDDCNDCLVEVDPVSGAIVKHYGDVGHSQVFGLAFWGGRAYGFTNAGVLFEIIFGDDTVTTTQIDVANAPSDLQFWGAGSSTEVPLMPPR